MSAWAAAAAAAAGAASGYFTGQQNRRNMKTSQAWRKEMRATAYQDTMVDMKKAGLNPMLAYMKGDTPMPSASNPTGGGDIGQGISSAVSAYQAKSQVAAQEANTDHSSAMAAKIRADTVMQIMQNEQFKKFGDSRTAKEAGGIMKMGGEFKKWFEKKFKGKKRPKGSLRRDLKRFEAEQARKPKSKKLFEKYKFKKEGYQKSWNRK